MFKTLVKYIGEFKRDAVLTPILVVMEVIMEVIIPIIMAVIIDYGLESRSLGKVVLIGLAMIAAAMLALWFGVESGRTASSASSGFAMNLRQAMYEKIQTFSFSNIDKFSTAGLVTRMTTDVMNVQQAFQMSIRICVRAPIMLVSAMVMTFMIHPRFARLFLVVIVCLAAVLALISSKANPTLRKVFHQYDELNATVQENVNGIRVVKSFVREDHEIGRFETESSTSAVDTKTDALIRRAFREKIPDTTKIIIAQRISSIQDADRILVFDNGRMKSVGTHEELLESSPIYREIYESQTKEGGDDDRKK